MGGVRAGVDVGCGECDAFLFFPESRVREMSVFLFLFLWFWELSRGKGVSGSSWEWKGVCVGRGCFTVMLFDRVDMQR